MSTAISPTVGSEASANHAADGHASATPSAGDHHGDHHHGDGHHDDGYHFAHPMPVPMLLIIFGVLTLLTIITVVQASYDFGSADIWIVMVIATIKASLVAFFFMHLAWDKPFNILLFFGSFVFVALFVIFTLNDSRLTSEAFIAAEEEVLPMETASDS